MRKPIGNNLKGTPESTPNRTPYNLTDTKDNQSIQIPVNTPDELSKNRPNRTSDKYNQYITGIITILTT